MGGSDGTRGTATTAADWEQTAESNSQTGGCRSQAGDTARHLGRVLSTKHTWCWRCFAGMKGSETQWIWVYFFPLRIQPSTGLSWGWAQQICPSWESLPCSMGIAALPVLAEPQELWPVIKSSLLRLSDLLGSSSMAIGGTSKLGFYFISFKFPSH